MATPCEIANYNFNYPVYKSSFCITTGNTYTKKVADIKEVYYEAVCDKDQITRYINSKINENLYAGWAVEEITPNVTPIFDGAFFRVTLRMRLKRYY